MNSKHKPPFLVAALVACLLTLFAAEASANGRYLEVTYPPSAQTGELSLGVTYRMWLPEGVKTVRGVIVHQHGCGVGSRKGAEPGAHDLHWQALCKKWGCALIMPSYHQEEKDNCRLWCDPRNGSHQTFLKCLTDLASQSGHPELERAPWCLWGHSGGGFWSSLMQTMYPERIVAIWFRSGTAFEYWEKGEVAKPEIPAAAMGIPMMCNPGAKENSDKKFSAAWTGTLTMFKAYRAKGAPIGFAPDPRTAHETGDSRYLAIPFFDACLALRLPDKGSNDQSLKPIDQKQAWLAPLLGDAAQPAAKFSGNLADSVWLPGEAFAKFWSQYVKTGATEDTTPPPSPTNVKAIVKPEGVVLTWDAEADFESGLTAFLIERDGRPLAQFPEKPQNKFGRPLFQNMSYGDTPVAPLLDFQFTDTTATDGKQHEYRVVAVNSAGLKSAASNATPKP
ncbi:MAG: hypothetical protein K9N47_01900 [Prosthecobacter sp.]|uniref:hypothetical protein n=1 Tax=Prosthecobacter sp. TaxID=1965333 RepID=UPI0025CCF7C9|nr:hypothetical protein [Prosthecobacter sp.]MCF7784841.1 hypothetical protein [Prosthecobacter sp.]